jgi:hypothetical protein
MKFRETIIYNRALELYIEIREILDGINEPEPELNAEVKKSVLDIAVKFSKCDNRLDFSQFEDNVLQTRASVYKSIVLLEIISRNFNSTFQKQMKALEEIVAQLDSMLYREVDDEWIKEMNEICKRALEESEN